MNRANPWLFEAPLISEAAQYINQEYYSNPELKPEYTPSPVVGNICVQGGQIANRLRRIQSARHNPDPLRRKYAIEAIQKRGARWINGRSKEMYSLLDKLHSRDLDRLNGCLTRVASAIGKDTVPLRQLRKEIEKRLGMSVR